MELTRNVGTLAESAKEASKVSDQISEILILVSDYSTTVHSLSRGVEALVKVSQGMSRMIPKAQKTLLNCTAHEHRK